MVRCFGFDSAAEIIGNWGDNVGTLPNDLGSRPDIDNKIRASGAGSLRFTIPSQTGANTSGSFFANFSRDLATQFGQGQEFFVQWRQRFERKMLRAFLGGGGWKLAIIGEGDQPGRQPTSSCTELEAVVSSDMRYMGPTFYHSCGRFISLDFYDGTQVRLQRQGPPYCYYPDDPQHGCFRYVANEWMTFQVHLQIGRWNKPSSRIQLWAAREGRPSVMIYDSIDAFPKGFTLFNNPGSGSDTNPGAKYGKIWLLPYNTNKDSSEMYPTTFTWYDELIVSTRKIADPQKHE